MPDGKESVVTASVNIMNNADDVLDAVFYKSIVQEFAKYYVKKNYNELVKQVDEDVIVKQVALAVSEEVLAKMFGRE